MPARSCWSTLVALCLGLWLSAQPVHAAPSADAIAAWHSELSRKASAESRSWQALMHVLPKEPNSPIRSPWYFFAANGAEAGPEAELHASLDALIADAPIALRDESARCAFPARLRFLQRQLGPEFAEAVASPHCPRRSQWLQGLAAEQLWVVFPAGYLNSPSSMFGHTLLRVDSAESARRGPLLAYAANFVAETQETNGLTFAIRGLSGGYTGAYGVLPYYEKVKEYVRMESRDLWEYPLQLNADERFQVLEHLWELRGAQFTYYFFTKNCAYQLLALLQTARPELDLLSGFDFWAIPTDTLRRLAAHQLLGPPNYRSALETGLRHKMASLPAPDQAQVHALAQNGVSPDHPDLQALSPKARARVLEVSHDLLYLQFQAGGSREKLLQQDRNLLAARAQIPLSSGFSKPERPSLAPEQGHATQRFSVALRQEAGAPRLALAHRFAYHDLLDAPGGYTPGSAISFGDLSLSLPLSGNGPEVQLDALRLIDIVSLAPRNRLLKPISWRVSTGLDRPRFGASALQGYLEGGPALAWPLDLPFAGSSTAPKTAWRQTLSQGGLIYSGLDLALRTGGGLHKGYQLAAGPSLGAVLPFSANSRAELKLSQRYGAWGDTRVQQAAFLGLQTELTPHWALRASGEWQRLADTREPQWQLAALRYF